MNNPIITDIIEDYKLEKVSESSVVDSFKKWISKAILWFKKIWYKIKSFFTGKKNDVRMFKKDRKQYILIKGVDNISNISKILEDKLSLYENLVSKLKNNEDVKANESELVIDISKINEYKKGIITFKGFPDRINVERLPYTDNDKVSPIIETIQKNTNKLFNNIINELTNIANHNDTNIDNCKKIINILQKVMPHIVGVCKALSDLNNNLLKKEYLNEEPLKIDSEFKAAVYKQNIDLVRIMLKDFIMIGILKHDTDIYLNYAESKLGKEKLYDSLPEPVVRVFDDITSDKFSGEVVSLLDNFTKENYNNMVKNAYNLYIVNWYKDV